MEIFFCGGPQDGAYCHLETPLLVVWCETFPPAGPRVTRLYCGLGSAARSEYYYRPDTGRYHFYQFVNPGIFTPGEEAA